MAALAGSAIGALDVAGDDLADPACAGARNAARAGPGPSRGALWRFIREASRLFVDAFEHELDDPAKLLQLYAIVSTIRLFGQPRTVEAAEQVMNQIGAAYFAPNKELRLFGDITRAGELDPLYDFSSACREELRLARA